MATDRQQFRSVRVGALGDLKSIANAALCLDQTDQRFHGYNLGVTATTATSDYTFPIARFDRPVQVKEVRVLPGGALVAATGNFVTLNVVYTNDNSQTAANGQCVATCNTNTAANGGTGNWAAGTSFVVPLWNSNTVANGGANALLNQTSNMMIPSGSQILITSTHTGGAGVAIPAGTRFAILVEEF